MSELATLQRDFMARLADGAPAAHAGIAVYAASVRANLTGALAATYPVVRRLVGDAFFAEAARRHAAAHPSASGDLGEYGSAFAHFLSGYAPAASLAFLPDVARLEWACHECESAEEPAPFDFAALARVAPHAYGELVLALHPAVRLLRSDHPVAAIHAANAPDRDGTPARVTGEDFVVVRRVEGRALVESVPAHEWSFVEALARGIPLGEASRALPPDATADFLARLVEGAVVCGFTAPRCAR